uniref:gamma-tubulin complex component 5-like n=1 Tax=Erigeron canadensis TaxID=72917 RepID=UPI001CB97D36|nr:gamma-tubulin complex component 5-like [Erigeron canadensis]XP_043628495.1 gamma-tubulin complex component 5-like [Erigeron canadensis]XP_043628496.1 gamma-tubulin complex component 5-like [Erigeron canadensis]
MMWSTTRLAAAIDRQSDNYLSSHYSDQRFSLSPILDSASEVRGVVDILQGLSSTLFQWKDKEGCYVVAAARDRDVNNNDKMVLDRLLYTASCLKSVEITLLNITTKTSSPSPTLFAFASASSSCLRNLRDIALKEQVNITNPDTPTFPTILGLATSLTSLCAGAEYLYKIVHGAIPSIEHAPAELAVYILDHLYHNLNNVCLDPEQHSYRMLLYIFVSSLVPYIEVLDSWIFEGILDDPFHEMFFYANKEIAVDEADFWDKSYLFRSTQHMKLGMVPLITSTHKNVFVSSKTKGQNERDFVVSPLFFKDISKEIISAGKSLQLIQHIPITSSSTPLDRNSERSMTQLSLSEIFCLSLAALIGHGDHMSQFFWKNDKIVSATESYEGTESIPGVAYSDKIWYKFLGDALPAKRENVDMKGEGMEFGVSFEPLVTSNSPENPTITVCQKLLQANTTNWNSLNLSKNYILPPLNDGDLRKAIFGGAGGELMTARGTDYAFRCTLEDSEKLHFQHDLKIVEALFPFPTILPSFKEDLLMSELLPFQKNGTLLSKVLSWIQTVEPKSTPLPVVILRECLTFYIKKQVDHIGNQILSKLLHDWKLMDELGVLRDVYLLGSGDLLQHFLTVVFDKLDKGKSWDDDFELNTVLQESIRNSADGTVLSSPDSLVVSLTKTDISSDGQQTTSFLVSSPRKTRASVSGINDLDSLKFTYKVPWPLELIANAEALKKYNQVMNFLLRVKRAKFVLDKARRWMWKERGVTTVNCKHRWLVEQKLLHFVDAFHQYVMDRVYHSAWRELCEGMAAAGSLDEVIEVHEAYLLSIQRQCFVVPDKLWALIASRINSILGLALDFYSVQQTLSSGGAVSATKAKCEKEVDRIGKQFDDCMAFLLRVLSFKLNVGQFPHLADLVTRINYNNFYMSDSGNLITAPGSDSINFKLAKTISV